MQQEKAGPDHRTRPSSSPGLPTHQPDPEMENEMTTTEMNEPTIVDEADLWKELKSRDLDVDLLTDYYRHLLWILWCKEVAGDAVPVTEVIETIVSEAEAMLEGCRRAFCPECGSSNLVELRDATVYLKIRSVNFGGHTSLMSNQDPGDSLSIMDSTDLVRCSDCDFESESEEVLYDTARLGAAEHGSIAVLPFVHAASVLLPGPELGARVHVYDPIMETWSKLVSDTRDTLPMPVAADSSLDEVERALRVIAGQVADMLEAIVKTEGPVEKSDDTYVLGELFDPICWSVTAEYAKQLQDK
ncbi:MAG: hypothetical protein J0H98_10680 [Solirubrobacterales bacterium]|nr:hypothetical protein [Solirubrobacterales bacterium]